MSVTHEFARPTIHENPTTGFFGIFASKYDDTGNVLNISQDVTRVWEFTNESGTRSGKARTTRNRNATTTLDRELALWDENGEAIQHDGVDMYVAFEGPAEQFIRQVPKLDDDGKPVLEDGKPVMVSDGELTTIGGKEAVIRTDAVVVIDRERYIADVEEIISGGRIAVTTGCIGVTIMSPGQKAKLNGMKTQAEKDAYVVEFESKHAVINPSNGERVYITHTPEGYDPEDASSPQPMSFPKLQRRYFMLNVVEDTDYCAEDAARLWELAQGAAEEAENVEEAVQIASKDAVEA